MFVFLRVTNFDLEMVMFLEVTRDLCLKEEGVTIFCFNRFFLVLGYF